MPALVDLSSDIIHEILTVVPDLKSLLSLLLTSKLFNDTFQAHPQSVLRDIASGQVGDALPQALRVVRCEAMNYRREDVKDLPSELDMTKQSITSLEVRALVDNAVVANALEDLFSQREKDKSSAVSQLTLAESASFQRALYRVWLYSAVYGADSHSDYDSEEEDDDEDDDNMSPYERLLWTKCRVFLASFAPCELAAMKEVSAFFHTVSVWAANAGSTTWLVNDGELGNRAAFHGPRTLLVCYQERDLNKLIDYVRGGERFFSGPFERVQTSRQKGQTQQSATQKAEESRRIVEHAVGASDACRRCGVVKGLDLFNESNWDLLQGVLGLQMSLLLPGRLPLNSTEVNKLREATCGITYAQIVAQLFRSKEIPFEELTERDWLCDVCVKDFIKHHFCRWWLDHKREAGLLQEDVTDCWYGWDCRTMLHKPAHAARLNHLCVPTRGEGIPRD